MKLLKNIGTALKTMGTVVKSIVTKGVKETASDTIKTPGMVDDILTTGKVVKGAVAIGGAALLAPVIAPLAKPLLAAAKPLLKAATNPIAGPPSEALKLSELSIDPGRIDTPSLLQSTPLIQHAAEAVSSGPLTSPGELTGTPVNKLIAGIVQGASTFLPKILSGVNDSLKTRVTESKITANASPVASAYQKPAQEGLVDTGIQNKTINTEKWYEKVPVWGWVVGAVVLAVTIFALIFRRKR